MHVTVRGYLVLLTFVLLICLDLPKRDECYTIAITTLMRSIIMWSLHLVRLSSLLLSVLVLLLVAVATGSVCLWCYYYCVGISAVVVVIYIYS